VAKEFVNPKNMTVGSNNPSGIVKATFHLSPSYYNLKILGIVKEKNLELR